jgi:RNA polymerase sigma-70 factor, ECF subfamily
MTHVHEVSESGQAGGQASPHKALSVHEQHEFEMFYSRTYRDIHGRAHRLVGSRHWLAEDVVQEAYLRAMRHWRELREYPEKRRRGWIAITVANVINETLRAESRTVPISISGLEAAESTVGQDFVPRIVIMRAFYDQVLLSAQTCRLPERMREIFLLRLLDYRNSEIAKMLGIAPSTVRVQVKNALDRVCRENVAVATIRETLRQERSS